jgi:PKD repeat protein
MVLAMLFVAGLVVAGAFGDVGGGLISSSGSTVTTTDSSSASSETATDTTPTTDATTTTSDTTTDSTTTTTTESTTTTPVYSPTISSDKPDYSPGETVTLTGGSWQAGEAVHIFVNDDQGQTWSYSTDVTANDTGGFVMSFALPSTFVALYSVTATGAISGAAKTTFTDGNVTLHLPATEGVANMTVTFDRYDSSTNCTGTVALHSTVTATSGGTVNIPGFGGNGKSVKLLSVTTTTAGKTFSKWTSGDKNTDSGTDIPGTPTPCISTDVAGTNGNVSDAYAHFTSSNSAPTVAADNASRTVNEGATATNTGTYSDPDSGDNVAITASVGTVTKTGTNSGTWSWSFGTNDGPAQSQTVTITANDGNGHIVTTTFSLTVVNIAPTATFNAPASVNEGSSISLSLTSPSDPSTVDTAAGFQYAFDCGTGSGYGAFSATSTASCPTTDNGSRTVKGEIKDKDGGLTEYTQAVTISNVAPTATLSNNGPIVEGGSATVSFSSPSDPSSADTTAGFHYSLACNGNAASLATTYAGAGTATSTTCSFADQGTFPVLGRIFDKDNGASTFTTNVVVTNANPVVTAPANQSSNEGASASFTLGSFSDAGVNDNPWSVDVNWGDGGPHTTFSQATQGSLGSQSHTYADSGSFTVTVKVTDKDSGSGQATFTVNVANLPPTATLSNNGPVNEGSPATISFSGQSDPSSADSAAGFHYAYACDNGSLAAATYAGSGTSASTNCTFGDNGSYTVRARIIDKDGGFTEYQTTATVNNVAPTATFNAPSSVTEGSPIALSLTSPFDPSSVDATAGFQYAFDCGDGSGYGAFGASNSTSCPTTDSGSRTVKGKIKDKDGGTTEYTASVTVNNANPTATLSNDGPINEGGSATISFSGQSDPSSGDTAAGFHYAYSCTNGDLSGATYAGSGSSASTTCSFADNGTFPVKARIIDKDGGFSEYTTNVIVNNVAPSVTAAASQSSDEGAAHSFDLGSFSDPGANDGPWSVDVDWGDGSPHTTFSAASQGALGSKSHTYNDNTLGGYTATVKVTDKDGGFNTATFNVDVANVAPSATFSNDGPVNEGSDFHLFLTSPSDPSGADTSAGFQYAFDCGSGYGAFSATASATCSTSDNGVRSVKGKIKDKDGGVSEYTASVTVNNVNPVVQAAAGQSSDEGASHSFSLGSFNDPGTGDSPWHVVVDWGDGHSDNFDASSQGSLGSLAHAYADNGSYTVAVSVTDKDGGSGSASFTATVANLAPSVTAAANQSSDEGASHSFSLGSFSDPGAGDAPWHVVVDWGDGHSSNFDTSSQGSLGSLAHTYQDNGSYSVSVSVTDKDGATGSAGFQVTVANVAPSVTAASDQSSDEGENHSFSLGTFSDPGVNDSPWLVNVSWGDGSPDTSFSNGAAQGSLGSRSHIYADNGTYTVTVQVTDKDGGVGSAQFKVTVANVAPSVTAPAGQSSDEGSSHSFSLGSFSDPGAGDNPWDVSVDWGDGSPDTPLAFSSPGSLGSASHTYDDNGSYTATVTVTDKDGASGQAQFSVTVANVAPTADLANDGPVDEGSPATISFSNASDPSSADTSAGFHYAFACDDGSLAGATYGGSGSADSTQCTFADNGTYPVRARIIDKDGGFSEYTTNVTVVNVAPSVTAAAGQSSDEGSSHSFSLGSFSDAGTGDAPWHVGVDWGDGHSSSFDTSSQGSLGSLAHTYDDNTAGGYTATVTVTDKDGGADSKSFNVDVHNVAPTATFNAPDSVDEGDSVALSLTSPSDPSGADAAAGFTYSFDCGSGYSAPSSTSSASCPTTDNGSRTVKGKIFDKDGGVSEYTHSVTIENVPPSVTAAADQSSDEGASHSFDLGSFTDPGADNPWTVDVNWGDGHSDSFTMAAPGTIPAHAHAYDDNGSYTVTVKVTDKDGGSDSKQFSVSVANVAPTATLSNDGPIFEGSSATVSFSNQLDPSSADTSAGFHYAFSCSNGDLSGATYGGSGTSTSTSCSFPDNVGSPFPVRARIIDKDGGFSEYTTYVIVNNVPPSVTAAANQSSDEGASHSFDLGSFTDPGADSPWTVDVNWGDGHNDSFTMSAPGTIPAHSHTYDDNTAGGNTVSVKVTDKDGASDTKSFNVDVANVAPTATFNAPSDVNEGDSIALSLTSPSDPSGADTSAGFEYAFDCGSGYGAFSGSSSTSCPTSDNGTRTVKGKIRDKDGGFTEYTQSVTIHNVPPSVTAAANQSSDEGASHSFDLGSFTDPGADSPWTVDVNWGDGHSDSFTMAAPGTIPAHSHTYDDNGSYTVTVKVTDKDGGSDTKSFNVDVANVAPTADLSNGGPVNEGSPVSVSFSNQHDASSADTSAGFHYAFDCNGGSLAGATYGGSGTSASTSCTFADNGTYPVTGRIIDKDGGATEYTTNVIVNNVPPSVTAAASQSSDEGAAHSFDLGSFSDPGADSPWTVDVNWGDGSPHTTFNASPGPLGSKSHTYDDNVTYTVTVKVTDKDGGSGQAQFTANVANVAPTASFSNDGPVSEGSDFHLFLSSPSDPSGADTSAGFQYAFDCGSGYGAFSATASATCSTSDNGVRSVKGKIKDKDGGVSEYTASVTVNNVNPAVAAPADQNANEGTSTSFSLGSFGDPGADSPWSVDVDWGDGSPHTTFSKTVTGSLGSQNHTYADNGSYTVKVKVTDKDGGYGSATFKVTVANVPPAVSAPADQNATEGGSQNFSLGSFTDPGPDGPWAVDVAWGDGSPHTTFNAASTGSLGTKPHTYADNGVYTVTVSVTDKDGGSDSKTFKVTVANANPAVTAPADQSASEGAAQSFSLGSFSDAGANDNPWSVDVDWGDGSAHTTFSQGSQGSLGSQSHTYAQNGAYTVTVKVTDKDGGSGQATFKANVANVPPSVTAPADQSSTEGASTSFNLGSFTDPGPDSPWAVDVDWGDGSAHTTFNQNATGSLGSQSHTYKDNGFYTVTVKVTDKDGGSGQATFKVSVSNVAPTITSLTATTTGLSGPLVFTAPVTFNGTFKDPGLIDNPWSADWSWDGTADPSAHQTYPANGTDTHNFTQSHQYTTAGCNHTGTVKVTDKDGGSDTKTITVGVGSGAFLPPVTNTPVTNKLKNGQVLPVKIQITDCNGAGVNNLSPSIRLVQGDQTSVPDDSVVPITPTSSSAADTTGVMRSAGSDGSYIYNMNVNIPLNTDYTIVVYPYGGTTGPTLKHVIQATK